MMESRSKVNDQSYRDVCVWRQKPPPKRKAAYDIIRSSNVRRLRHCGACVPASDSEGGHNRTANLAAGGRLMRSDPAISVRFQRDGWGDRGGSAEVSEVFNFGADGDA